jgi:hypothetical protein
MSWTINAPTEEDLNDEFKELERAIIEASQADILMFCSASDEGARQESTYPSKAVNKIFKIGGADPYGNVYKPVGEPKAVDFILPGKLVKGEDLSDTAVKKVQQYWTGSSVATALAAGLAALILYCAQLRIVRATPAQRDKAIRDFQTLKQHERMMEAFKNIGTTTDSNKYLAVWGVFGKKVAESKNGYDSSDCLDLVADVATTLCMKF